MRGNLGRSGMDRGGVDRGYASRPQYGRRDVADNRGGRGYQNSPGRYAGNREYEGYGGSREYRDNYGGRDYRNSPGRYANNREYRDNYGGRDYRDYGGNREYRDGYYDNGPDRRYPVRDRAAPYDRSRVPQNRDYNRRYDSYQESRGGADLGRYDSDYKGYGRPGPSAPSGAGPIRRPYNTLERSRTKIFIGNLTGEVSQEELTTKFSTFGHINKVDFRRKFAFVDYARPRDAEIAIKEMNGKTYWGSRLKVQPHIEQPKKNTMTREPNPACQATVLNLDQTVSWQDLKDFARQAGDVVYASIVTKGQRRFGLIEFADEATVINACKELSGKKIANNKLEIVHMPVSEYVKSVDDGSK